MPPKPKKAAPGPKRTKPAAVKSQLKPHVTVDEKIESEVENKGKDLSFDQSGGDNDPKGKSLSDLNDNNNQANGSTPSKKEDEVKEDEYEIDERLELEDNEPDYEPEEYGGEYDEKEVDEEEEEVQVEGDEEMVEEEVDEEEADLCEEDLEDVQEEPDCEDDEHADADAGDGDGDGPHHEEELEHTDLIEAAEAQEHHDVVKERRKRKEYEVFVGGLDKDATEEDLKEAFGSVGEITEIRLMMNHQTKKNKGFAFLRFATVEQAKRAVTELKNPVVKGKQCGVTPSQDSDTLFLGNICKTWTMEKLREKLKLYGIVNIEDLTLVEDNNNEGKNRGFGFLEFASRSDAMDAFKRLQKRDVLLGVDRPAKVSFADSFIDPGDEIMAQVKTVFIDGLLASWDEDRVRDLLKAFGTIDKVELARNMPSARRKDFGFVSFDSHEAAVACAKSINNTDLGEGDHKAKVRCRLSRPLQRGSKGKGYSRGGDRGGRIPGRRLRAPWNRPLPRPAPLRSAPPRPRARGFGSRRAPAPAKRPVRRAPPPMPPRSRPLPPPPRSYSRRAPAPPPPKSSMKRDYSRREVAPPRSRGSEYGSRLPPERRPSSYRDEYASPRSPAYPDVHRSSASRSATRRAYLDDSYSSQRYERPPPPSYREGRGRDYDSMSGSKRPYSSVDDVPSRYADPGARHSRARLDFDIPGGSSQYDGYSDRLGRSTAGYSSSGRSSLSAQDSHGVYSSRQGMGYSGSYGGSDVGGGVYSSSYGGDYASRGSDVGGSSYSSLYGSRGMGGSSYMGGGSSGSYY